MILQLPNGESLHERKLRDSLEAEREAVLDFMYTTVDSVSVAFLESFPQFNWQGRSCKTVNQLDGIYLNILKQVFIFFLTSDCKPAFEKPQILLRQVSEGE